MPFSDRLPKMIFRKRTFRKAVSKATVILAINTGMRKGEIRNLRWQDVDFEHGVICILEQKNGDKSYIPMNGFVRSALMRIERRVGTDFVFCKSVKRRYDIRKAFNLALKSAGIKDASFHTLRHTFASHLAMSGVDLNTIRELMRHKSLKMTQRYAHLSKDHKSKAAEVLAEQMDTFWTQCPQEQSNLEPAKRVTQSESAS